jgi:hypothetical protein
LDEKIKTLKKLLKRQDLKRKILSIKTSFFSISGFNRTENKPYHYTFRLVKQKRKGMRNLVSAKKITKKGSFYRSIAIEGIKYLLVNKKRYTIVKNKCESCPHRADCQR